MRTLTPALLIYLIFTMDEKGIWKGLLGHFQRRIDTPSASAFVQQRQKLADGSTQMLITNLDPAQFPLSALQKLYAKRWGIETSFRELKYTVGLIHLYSRKSDLVLQEIFAAFTIFNFTQAVAWSTDEAWGRSKYERRVNFSRAVYLCCEVLRGKAGEITGLLERTLRPRRPNRSYPRPKIAGNRISPTYVPAR